MVIGIYCEQFQQITQLLVEGPDTNLNTKIIVILEKKQVFSKFYEILKNRIRKINDKIPVNNSYEAIYQNRINLY